MRRTVNSEVYPPKSKRHRSAVNHTDIGSCQQWKAYQDRRLTPQSMAMESTPKKRKLRHSQRDHPGSHDEPISVEDAVTVNAVTHLDRENALTRPISPPVFKRQKKVESIPTEQPKINQSTSPNDQNVQSALIERKHLSSPVQLTHVQGLSSANNVDTVRLRDIVGDPLIRECWAFNYLFDVDFLMSQLDEDVREQVQVKIVHGSWKRDNSNKLHIDEAASRWKNVQAITAYMPEAFGTHHSKMLILIRHDDLAQIVISTANMISCDWSMCQAVWRSPLLPLQGPELNEHDAASGGVMPVGNGVRFKFDLLNYLRAYGPTKLGALTAQLKGYDFRAIRAALVASTPGKQEICDSNPDPKTLWGWPGLRNVLKHIPSAPSLTPSRVVIQVSSVASLGAGDKWLKSTFLDALAITKPAEKSAHSKLQFSIVFPTADEIRRSLKGYSSGGSIHMKTQTAAQAKQVDYLRPMLCHWASDTIPRGLSLPSSSSSSSLTTTTAPHKAGRRRAAPHIKTYIRFSDNSMKTIDWAMMTSANLSTQAWGAATNGMGEVRICSYEIGVVVWPALWDDGVDGSAAMVPAFKKDMPEGNALSETKGSDGRTLVGLRMPYDLPLSPYAPEEMPWCATARHTEPDWMGGVWLGSSGV